MAQVCWVIPGVSNCPPSIPLFFLIFIYDPSVIIVGSKYPSSVALPEVSSTLH